MECTSGTDARTHPIFVSWSVPNTRRPIVPNCQQIIQGESRLVYGEIAAQYDARLVATTSTNAFPQHDACYRSHSLNLDAHSAEGRSTTAREAGVYKRENGGAPPKAVYWIKLKTTDILFRIRSESSDLPITFENHAADSAISEVTLLGLHNNESTCRSYISIVEICFNSLEFSQRVSQTKCIVAKLQQFNNLEVSGSVNSVRDGSICTVLNDLLSHLHIFYCKYPFIEIQVELFDNAPPPDHEHTGLCYTITPAIQHLETPALAAVIDDDDEILNDHPPYNLLPFFILPPCLCERSCLVNLDSTHYTTPLPESTRHPMTVVQDVSITEHNSFTLALDRSYLYSIIKGKETQPYPSSFNVPLKIEENKTLPIVMTIFPLKRGGKHLSFITKLSSPIEQTSSNGHLTIKAAAFNQQFGSLGETTTYTKPLSSCKQDTARVFRDAVLVKLILERVMLEVHAFYCKNVQINVEMSWNLQCG